jgi:hypothetical protein
MAGMIVVMELELVVVVVVVVVVGGGHNSSSSKNAKMETRQEVCI